VSRFRFVEAEAAQFPVSLLCRVVGVTRQGYYAWKRRPPSARELADRKLCERIREIYSETEEIYGHRGSSLSSSSATASGLARSGWLD
jgi:putative transposase